MKKSHKWEELPAVEVRCPHCGEWMDATGITGEGDVVHCDAPNCLKSFELGVQK